MIEAFIVSYHIERSEPYLVVDSLNHEEYVRERDLSHLPTTPELVERFRNRVNGWERDIMPIALAEESQIRSDRQRAGLPEVAGGTRITRERLHEMLSPPVPLNLRYRPGMFAAFRHLPDHGATDVFILALNIDQSVPYHVITERGSILDVREDQIVRILFPDPELIERFREVTHEWQSLHGPIPDSDEMPELREAAIRVPAFVDDMPTLIDARVAEEIRRLQQLVDLMTQLHDGYTKEAQKQEQYRKWLQETHPKIFMEHESLYLKWALTPK